MNLPGWLRWLLTYRKLLFTILYPIILSPILIVNPSSEAKGAYTLLLMAGYWITESISIYVTAMLPLLMGPLMGIIASKAASAAYMRNASMLFIQGAFLAVAAEHRNIHRRISAAVLRIMGGDPRLLLLGLMLPTWFLSMWMSNTAATIMMLTTVEALMSRLESLKPNVEEDAAPAKKNEADGEAWNTGDSNESVTVKSGGGSDGDDLQKLGCCFSLGIAFASSCGGMGTVIGTPTNVVLFGLVSDRYGFDTGLTFGSWAAYGMPLSLILLICVWVILGVIFIGPKWADGSAMAILALVILLWISRKPGVDGWSAIVPFKTSPTGKRIELTTDTQPAVLGSILICIWPAYNPFRRRRPDQPPVDALETVLPWKVAQSRCPWQVLLLIGGGFCLSDICNVSGLSTRVGQYMLGLKSLPPVVLILVFGLLCITHDQLRRQRGHCYRASTHHVRIDSPVLYRFTGAISASMAFILPAGTPANAIVYSKGRININQMVGNHEFSCDLAGRFLALESREQHRCALRALMCCLCDEIDRNLESIDKGCRVVFTHHFIDRNKYVTVDESSACIDRPLELTDGSSARSLAFILPRFFGEPRVEGWSSPIPSGCNPGDRAIPQRSTIETMKLK
ncbi:Solute carrier family 13 member [Echinococcus granulosus]|uniref:Solute carrier family 13 member n=1 Tax=Echinococcus granulosus TaxID=6210 RepID=W6UCC9_ECHGR|nr:Solute carrier family 13 member [Echinococcus granulosus]EUB58910.1 Solute carrier family 13 member [Echinococcus granulosus]